MKKVNKTTTTPDLLGDYFQNNLLDSWQQFCANNGGPGYKQLKDTLNGDQRGLCAYCEIDLAQYAGVGLDDFRVEHFHPKSPHQPPPNHGLDWQNMLGVCSGGNVRGIGDAARFTQPDYCCDVPKGDNNWVGVILSPLHDVPAFPPLFTFQEDGRMFVGSQCPKHLQEKAQATIANLRLSPAPDKKRPDPRLIRFREKTIATLRQQIADRMQTNGGDVEEALAYFAEVYFSDTTDVPWPAFFSCIRWYLDAAAEARLSAIQYMA